MTGRKPLTGRAAPLVNRSAPLTSRRPESDWTPTAHDMDCHARLVAGLPLALDGAKRARRVARWLAAAARQR